MKTLQLFTYGALAAVATAQSISSLPACGQLCVNNMLEKASELGCASGDAACLCNNMNFAYGIRDCSNAACGPEAAIPVIAYGNQYCSGAGVGGSQSSSAMASSTMNGLNPSGPSTTASVTTKSEDSETGTSTIGIIVSTQTENAFPSSASSLTSSIASSASSARASLSSQLSSVSSQASSASESATATSSSSGARQTAIAGLAAAAGFVGLLL